MVAVLAMHMVSARHQVVLLVLQLVLVQLRQMLVAQEKKAAYVALETGAVAVVVVLEQPVRQQ